MATNTTTNARLAAEKAAYRARWEQAVQALTAQWTNGPSGWCADHARTMAQRHLQYHLSQNTLRERVAELID